MRKGEAARVRTLLRLVLVFQRHIIEGLTQGGIKE